MYNRYISSTLQNLNVVFQVEWLGHPLDFPVTMFLLAFLDMTVDNVP